jgi:hypothetical protein
MKPTDFLPEKHSIGQAAVSMHVDHEIQMAREECYHAATNAMELHRMLKQVSEEEGLQAWASEKITLANDYLRTVKEWLEYEIMTKLEQGVAENNPLPLATLNNNPVLGPEVLENDERGEGAAMQQQHRARLERERGETGRDPAPTGQWYLMVNGSSYKRNGETVMYPSPAAMSKDIERITQYRKSKGWGVASFRPVEQKGMGEQQVQEFSSAGASSTSSGGFATSFAPGVKSKMFKRAS